MIFAGGALGVPARLDGRGARPSTGGLRANVKMRFSDKVVLVAGGTGGLGRAVSLAFLLGREAPNIFHPRRAAAVSLWTA